MRAAVYTHYGPPDVLEVRDIETPRLTDDEVLVRVRRSTVNRTDDGFLRAHPFVTRLFSGLTRPRHPALGCEFAGDVAEVGKAVERFAVGDRVFGFDDKGWGGHAEYKVIAHDAGIAKIPDGIDYDQAAASTEGAHYAMMYLEAANIRAGQRVLVHSATGAVGSAAIQLLHQLGAHVTATSDTQHLDLATSLGAEVVIDRERSDFTACGETFDVVFDAVGKSTFGACKCLLVPGGIYMSTELGPYLENPLRGIASPLFARAGAKRVLFPLPTYDQGTIERLAEYLARGELRPVIDRRYPLDDIVAAFRYVETGQKIGNVVIEIA